MSVNQNGFYSKSVLFTLVATVTVLIGTIATVFYPMFTEGMNPKLANLQPFTALELAGRDLYQREGCVNCHTQTVRPLKTEVMRYGEYSKAGEFAYDRPFLWGSKRTGPDLARIGGKYSDAWHVAHMANPRTFYADSNMPGYAFLADRMVNANATRRGMQGLGFPFSEEEIAALSQKTEMDAIIAYMQVTGAAVTGGIKRGGQLNLDEVETVSPLDGNPSAAAAGRNAYIALCAGCHGDQAQGVQANDYYAPSLVVHAQMNLEDRMTFVIIAQGGRGMGFLMPRYHEQLTKDEIWSVVEYLKTLRQQ